jgi:L-alanine-DL-glutamate epimerase-like enolase superfamily enzyme
MILRNLEASELAIPFKGAFKHASAERHTMQSLWVRAIAENGEVGFGEGCPREYVTAESISTALAFVDHHRAEWLSSLQGLQALKNWVTTHGPGIDAHPAAWTAVELAMFDLFGKLRQCSVERLLEVPELAGRFRYTAVLGDGSSQQFAAQLQQFLKAGFGTFKIKLSPDMGENEAKARLLTDAGIAGDAVRADANNLWHDAEACVRDLGSLPYRFTALEEPLQPGDFAGLVAVAQSLNTRIILDESASRVEQLDRIPPSPGRWIVNCRVSKMGGLLRSLHFVQAAISRDLGIIVGAHVGETSVLTRAALTLASATGNSLLAQEGAFGTHLLTRDVANPPLMFGAGGAIDAVATGLAGRAGFGLNISGAV